MIEPYGAQREACLVGRFDDDGWLVDNPMPRAAFAMQLRGAIDAPRLAAALVEAAASIDAWRARLRRVGDGFALVPDAGEAQLVVTLATGDPRPAFEAVRYAPWNLRHDPPGRACVVEVEPDRHVVLLVADHASWDGVSIAACFRRAVAIYLGLPAAPGTSFAAHAAREDRAASRAFWAAAMDHPMVEPRFPGGRGKPWSERRGTRVVHAAFDPAPLDAARTRLAVRRTSLFVATLGFVVELWADASVPVLYARAGRPGAGDALVEGPLHEAAVTLPAHGIPPHGATLADTIRARARSITDSPPLHGQWLSDFGGITALRERRLVVVNSLPAALIDDFALGGLVGGPADPAILASLRPPPGHAGLPPYNGLHLFMRWTASSVTAAVYHDRDILPDPRPVLRAQHQLLAALLATPDADPRAVADQLRRDWSADH